MQMEEFYLGFDKNYRRDKNTTKFLNSTMPKAYFPEFH